MTQAAASSATPPAATKGPVVRALAALALLVVTMATFAPVHRLQFINFDDPLYLNHPRVRAGLSWENVAWAMVATDVNYWHPLTWLSYMLDVELWGTDPGPPHLFNAILHALNALLLLLVLHLLTGRFWLALTAAALFAVHPLRVESVAWVSERKDLLCAFFYFLTIAAYAACVRRPSLPRYLGVILFCLLALMSKPMAVTLPFVLLLLDYWPLGRLRFARAQPDAPAGETIWRLVAEKLPLFVLVLAASLLALSAQSSVGAVVTLREHSLMGRLTGPLLGYVRYVGKIVWPADLVILYPLEPWPLLWVVTCAAALGLATALALLAASRWPFVTVGWLWFLGTLVPVIGIVQVGRQAIADRYTYIPGVGVAIVLVWGVAALVERSPAARRLASAAAAVALVVLIVLTQRQLVYWEGGTQALFRRAVEVHERNPKAYYALAYEHALRGQTSAAFTHLDRSLELWPEHNKAHCLLGHLLRKRGQIQEAIASLRTSLELDPNFWFAWQELGIAQALAGDDDSAARSLSRALELNPASSEIKRRLAELHHPPTSTEPAPTTQPALGSPQADLR